MNPDKSDMTEKPKRTGMPKMPKLSKLPKQDPVADLTADLQRVQADFENYKKRVAGERSDLMDGAKRAVLTDLLPALDNFDRASTHLPTHLESDPWAQGMSYIGKQLEQILDDMGVKKYSPQLGEAFDHNRMDALEHIPSDHPPETVAEILTPGYEIAGQITRPASVRVSSGPPDITEAPDLANETNHNEKGDK